jgi:hypothetical protein
MMIVVGLRKLEVLPWRTPHDFEYNVAGTESGEGGNKKFDIPDYYGHKIHWRYGS